MSVLIEWTVDAVVKNVPEAVPVLAGLGIDPQEDGELVLREATLEHGHTTDELLAALLPALAAA
ncbi:MAG TPA: hypothetical protein VFS40_01365 [Gemmatimonadales bacterium]|nr:hypothetical protein [Gemmatimonadales bacterium]